MSSTSASFGHPSISVSNRQRRTPLSRADLEQFAVTILPKVFRHPGPHGSALRELEEIAIYLVSDRRMSRLHADFSRVPGPTDILTFHHGEIFISVDTARRQAAEYGNTLERELRIYVVHGLLHLHGHDDHTPEEATEMHRLQEMLVG
jgi:probable rRNA maturation factor